MKQEKFDFLGYALITILLILLTYAGYISFKSIDWDVLKKLESQSLVLPTPQIATSSATQDSSSSSTISPTKN